MKPGDLRRFKDDVIVPSWRSRPFLVLEVYSNDDIGRLDALIDGKVQVLMLSQWVEGVSEVLCEAR